jgi:hypothetical protein
MKAKRLVLRFLTIGFIGGMLLTSLFSYPQHLAAQQRSFSIATGGTGGVYYVLGGGIANFLTKSIPNTKFTAEATAASVDNAKLIEVQKADFSFIAGDVAYDAYTGKGKFKNKVALRNLLVPYSDYIQFVALEGAGINSVKDLRGKRVSIGAPGSGTEVKGMRLLEAYGIDPEKDIKRDRLSVAESAAAMKDRKIDAFNWAGGLPTAAIMDLAATPGVRIKILDLGDVIAKLIEKHGPVYFAGVIPKGTYAGVPYDVNTPCVANVFCCHEKMDEEMAYQVTKLIIEGKQELTLVHKEANHITLRECATGSPIPYHPGAIRYYKEKGITIKQ